MLLEELVQTRRADILQAAAKHGAYNVRSFGSVARGDANEHSDLDFLVDMKAGRSLFDLGGLLTDLEDLLGLLCRCRDREGTEGPHSATCLTRGDPAMRETLERIRSIPLCEKSLPGEDVSRHSMR